MSEIDYTQFSNNTLILMIKDNKDRNKILERELGKLEAELVRLREVERKAIEQSEYVQSHGLTEYEFGLLRAELNTLRKQADGLAQALEEAREHIKLYVSLRNLPRHAQNPGSKPLILVDIDAALADWRKGE